MREQGQFYNIHTNKYIPDNAGTRRAYASNPDRYELPIGLAFNGYTFIKNTQPASITLRFSTYRQKGSRFIIPNTQIEQGEQTFLYYSRADLKQKKKDFLTSLNQDYDENGDYEEVFYFDEEVGNLFQSSPEYRGNTKQTLPPLFMGKLRVLYKYTTLDHKYIAEYPDRCVWNYLINKVGISDKILKKYNNEEDDKWGLDNLLELARSENYRLQIYDTQLNILQINDQDAIFLPDDHRKHRKTICFMVADNHIYPFTDGFQKKLLTTSNEDRTNDNTNFGLNEKVKTLDTINNIENDEERAEALEDRRVEEAKAQNHIAINEWEFVPELTEIYPKIYIKNRRAVNSENQVKELPANNLNQVAEILYQKTQSIYPCSIHEGDIKTIYYQEYCPEAKKKIKKWEIFADPNYEVCSAMCENLGIIYNHTCISSIGNIVYSQKHKLKYLKSDMLDEVLATPYRAFNNNQLIGIPDENQQIQDFNPESELLEYSSIDINKSYSYGLENPETDWCVYSPLDSIEKYKNSPKKQPKKHTNFVIKNYDKLHYKTGWYYIETNYNKNIHGLFIPFERMFPNGWYCVAVLTLADQKNIPYTIIKQYLPEKTIPKDHFKEFVGDLYEKLGDKAKLPINSFIGRLGKRDQVKLKCKGSVITNEYDCKYFKNKKQIVKPISKNLYTSYTYKTEEAQTIASPIYNQIIQEAWCRLQKLYDSIIFTRMENIGTVNYTELEWKFGMRNGKSHFLGEMPYEEYVKKTVLKKNIQIGGAVYFNTDSVVLVGDDINYMIKKLDIGTKRGQYRIEWDKANRDYHNRIDTIKKRKINEYMIEEIPSVIHTKPIENYSKSSINGLIEAEQGFQLLGMAGTGKSYTTVSIIKTLKEKNISFKVCAFTHSATHNKLFIENEIEGQTLHSFLKYNFNNPYAKPNYSNCEKLDYILIDECSLIPEYMLVSFRNIKQKYKTKFILIGDYQQLDPVMKSDYDNDTIASSSMIKYLTDYNRIVLTENMRSGEEGTYMFNLFNSILYGKQVDITRHKLKTHWRDSNPYPLLHICYDNKKRQEINNFVIQDILRLYKPKRYIIMNPATVKQPLIGFHGIFIRANSNTQHYYNNQTFNMVDVNDEYITIKDTILKKDMCISFEEYHKNFEYGYAGTCHKYQGATIPSTQPFIIHQWNKIQACMPTAKARRWLYVATSRASNSTQFKIV
tara:strand:- start:4689 stop:8276 length:3588 start_codon:yes stop_codon:yes gene_type:complete